MCAFFLCCTPCLRLTVYPALRRRSSASLFSYRRTTILFISALSHCPGFIGLEYSHGCMGSSDGAHFPGKTFNSSNTSKASPRPYEKSYHANTFSESSKGDANFQSEENCKTNHEERQNSSKSTSAEEEERGSNNTHFDAEWDKTHNKGTATSRERLGIAKKWENAFFGRNLYEPGMREHFQEAVQSEAQDELGRKSFTALLPSWPEDEATPLEEFRQVPAVLRLRFIIHRLTMAERRIRYAVDYGSLSMMYQLNLGELMLHDAEVLLKAMDWLNDEVQERIEDLKGIVVRVKYDYDLD
ncbi:unnamed protein product [Phytomonas sp. Hart1]|nr:unnamed protein product [Phytomonas sp. Hart1]|eukprot:CCW66817.1 unnamed protein product [Phytomonas sp. isolate Hart1]